MGLEDEHEPRRPARTRRIDDRGDLAGMVPVVVDDRHAVDNADDLEPAFGAAELDEGLGDARERHLDVEPHADRRERVQHVVPARHRQAERAERARRAIAGALLDDARRGERLEPHVDRTQFRVLRRDAVRHHAPREARQQRAQRRVVGTGHHRPVERHAVGERHEGVADRIERPVVVEVLAIDVRDDRR